MFYSVQNSLRLLPHSSRSHRTHTEQYRYPCPLNPCRAWLIPVIPLIPSQGRVDSRLLEQVARLSDFYLSTCPPVSRHRPGDFLRRVRQFSPQDFPHILKLIPDAFILCEDIFVYRFLGFPTKMMLIFISERASAFWTFPHSFHFLRVFFYLHSPKWNLTICSDFFLNYTEKSTSFQ